MTKQRGIHLILALLIVLLVTVSSSADAQTASGPVPVTTIQLIAKLRGNEPYDLKSLLLTLETQPPSAEVIPALSEAFEKRQFDEDKQSREDKQAIAVTLIHFGVKDDRYYQLLERYAREAIEDRTPVWYVKDSNGDAVRGEMRPEFLLWCKEHDKDPKEVVGIQLYRHMSDLWSLGDAGDPRAGELLKRGLQSTNDTVIFASVHALARLRDVSALPLIVQACERASPNAARFMARELASYLTPEANAIMARFIKNDAKGIEWEKRQAMERRNREKEVTARWEAFRRTTQ